MPILLSASHSSLIDTCIKNYIHILK